MRHHTTTLRCLRCNEPIGYTVNWSQDGAGQPRFDVNLKCGTGTFGEQSRTLRPRALTSLRACMARLRRLTSQARQHER